MERINAGRIKERVNVKGSVDSLQPQRQVAVVPLTIRDDCGRSGR